MDNVKKIFYYCQYIITKLKFYNTGNGVTNRKVYVWIEDSKYAVNWYKTISNHPYISPRVQRFGTQQYFYMGPDLKDEE